MKRLIILVSILFSSATFACTDFNGTYRAIEREDIIKISQAGCEMLLFSGDGISFNFPIDGKFNLLASDKNSSVFVKVQINGEKLLIDTKLELRVSKDNLGEDFAFRTFSEASKQSDGEILKKTTYVNKNGVIIKQEILTLERISN